MTEQTVRVTVDGKEFFVSGEKTILQLFNESNLEHPQICYVPEVDPIQTCDTCIVEVNGKLRPYLVRQKLEDGMDIEIGNQQGKRSPNRSHGSDIRKSFFILYCM